MARRTTSLANTDNATFTVGLAKLRKPDGLFVPTDDESSTNNRQVYYTVRCKSCKDAYTKAKPALSKTHSCPACGTKHQPAVPRAAELLSVYKKQTILVLSESKVVLINDNKDNAIVNQTPADYLKWHDFGRKVFVSRGHMEFELDQAEAALAFKLPMPQTEIVENDEFMPVSQELEEHLADLEGYHQSLAEFPKKFKLKAHDSNRRNFEGWLVSLSNFRLAKAGGKPYTDARKSLIEKLGSDVGLYDTFHGMPVHWSNLATGVDENTRGWVYVYRFPAGFDPTSVTLPVEEAMKYNRDSNAESIKLDFWFRTAVGKNRKD